MKFERLSIIGSLFLRIQFVFRHILIETEKYSDYQ